MADKVIKPGTGGDQYIPFDKRTGDSSVVYFTRDLSPEGLVRIFDKVGQVLEGRIAVKLHTGEKNGPNTIPRAFVRELFEKRLPDATIIETNTYYEGDRYTTEQHIKEMSVGKSMLDYDSMLALTHFKGHVQGGFGGSNKNIGIGCADGRIGKAMIHTTPGQSDMWDIKTEELMERIAESTKATISFFGKNVAYINVMRNMSVSCDCEGVAAQPVVTPDVGIVASLDILAADQACIDLVYALPEESHAALIERMESRHGLRQLTYMKELNMGNDRYTLIDIDHDDREITAAQAVEGISGGWVPDAYNRIHK